MSNNIMHLLDQIIEHSVKLYKGHGYATGAFSAIINTMWDDLTPEAQHKLEQLLQNEAKDLEKDVLLAILKDQDDHS